MYKTISIYFMSLIFSTGAYSQQLMVNGQHTVEDQVAIITDLFGQLANCPLSAVCTISRFNARKLDANGTDVTTLVETFPDFFESIIKKKGKFVNSETFDVEEGVFPHWAFLAGDLYLFFGVIQNGDSYEMVNVYKITKGHSFQIFSVNESIEEQFSYDPFLLSIFLNSFDNLNQQHSLEGVSFVGLSEMEEGGTQYYKMSNGKSICMVGESGSGIAYYCE